MQRRTLFEASLASFSTLLYPKFVQAVTPSTHVAKVERVEGRVLVAIAGTVKPLTAGQRLPLHAEIRTEASGLARLRLISSGALVIMGHRSQLTLDFTHTVSDPMRQVVGQLEILALRLMQGALRYVSEHHQDRRQQQNVTVALPTATVGIRGTDFYAESENKQDIVCLFDGQVDVTQYSGRVFELRERFDFYRASHDGTRSEQSRAEPQQVSRWKGRFYPLGLSGDPPPEDGASNY